MYARISRGVISIEAEEAVTKMYLCYIPRYFTWDMEFLIMYRSYIHVHVAFHVNTWIILVATPYCTYLYTIHVHVQCMCVHYVQCTYTQVVYTCTCITCA